MSLEFRGEIWHWAGPAPFFFVTVPAEECEILRDVASWVTYGWGMIPVGVRIGDTSWRTSLFPKEGGYVVPIKASVREAEGIGEGDRVTVRLEVGA